MAQRMASRERNCDDAGHEARQIAGRGITQPALTPGGDVARPPISPRREMGAYEALFLEKGASFAKLADRFRQDGGALPSDFVPGDLADRCAREATDALRRSGIEDFGILVHGADGYPLRLRDAEHPVELLYRQGDPGLLEMPALAVIGSRRASEAGMLRAARLARELVGRGFAVVSGLAAGVDAAAHAAALDAGGRTIAVMGTPLGESYPPENRALQDRIARDHLLVSQVPVLAHARQSLRQKRRNFPERNATMSALALGTVIVEAQERSGTLTQAPAARYQGRKLFVLDSCFRDPVSAWPHRLEEQGAIRVRNPEDIWDALSE